MSQIVLGNGFGGIDIGDFDVDLIRDGVRTLINPGLIRVAASGGWTYEFTGSGFAQSGGQITAGTVTGFSALLNNAPFITITQANTPAQGLFAAISAGNVTSFNDALLSGADVISGSTSGDFWEGQGGDDFFTGGGGIDLFQGGAGLDTAGYSDARANYEIIVGSGVTQVKGKVGSTGHVDFLGSVERVSFANGTLDLSKLDSAIVSSASAVLRVAPTTSDLALDVGNAFISRSVAVANIVDMADTTSSVATLSYQFFTGRTPTNDGMDYLVSTTGSNLNNLNSAYYQSFNIENRYINFAVNLGRFGEGATGFTNGYGGLNLFDATRKAYTEIFGGVPSDTTVTGLLSGGRDAYFAFYGRDGVNGQGTKAAMVGWLLAEAAKADIGVYALSNEALLADVALNGAQFGANLIGQYSQPSFVYNPG